MCSIWYPLKQKCLQLVSIRKYRQIRPGGFFGKREPPKNSQKPSAPVILTSFSTICIQRHQHAHMGQCYNCGLNTLDKSLRHKSKQLLPSIGDRTLPLSNCFTGFLSLLVFYFSFSLIFSCYVNPRYTRWIPVRSDGALNICLLCSIESWPPCGSLQVNTVLYKWSMCYTTHIYVSV